MKYRIANLFFLSAATVLLVTAAAKGYSATGKASILTMADPVLHLNNRLLMLGVALLETAVAVYLLFGRFDLGRAAALLFLSGNFLGYRAAARLLGEQICPCLGTLASKLPFTPEFSNRVLTVFVVYWLIGSAWIFWRERAGRLSPDAPKSMACQRS